MSEYPLEGLRIIDLSHYIAGPYCTKLLCGLGADVIKVERPDGGDGARKLGPFPGDKPNSERSGVFSFLNAGKKGITLNLKTQSGVEIFKKLIKDADVLVENFEPRVMSSLGLSYDSLAKINPKLAMVSISNFGQYGPYRDYKATEIIAEALGGYMYLVGTYDREPVKSGIYLAQYYAGAAGAAAALATTYGTDDGQHLDISLMESVAFSLFYPLGSYSYYGAIPRRSPKIESAELAYSFLPAQNGFVYPLTYGYVDWGTLARVVLEAPELDNPKFNDFDARTGHIEELKAIMLSIFNDKSAQAIFHKAQSVGFPWGFVRRMDEVANCPQLLARGFYQVASDSAGQEMQWPEKPFSMATPWKAGKPPLLGEHNEEIYCGYLGYSKKEVAELRKSNII
jgi:CoA:oxalate CoA-transferase